MSWQETVDQWFHQKWIDSATMSAENCITIMPGNIENFGFHFSRDLIPFGSNITVSETPKSYSISYQNWGSLSDIDQTIWLAFSKNARRFL